MTLTRVTLRELTAEERQSLEQLAASRTAQARLVERARILLAIADGRAPGQVASDLGLSPPTVYTRIHRFEVVCRAVEEATGYWNKHRHPFVWGRRRRHRPRRRPGIAAVPGIRGLAG
jgi:DNA-binding CsgD family transcriptional regulator